MVTGGSAEHLAGAIGGSFADQPWVAFGVAFAVMAAVGAVIGVRERRHVRRERAAVAASAPDRDPASAGDLSSPS